MPSCTNRAPVEAWRLRQLWSMAGCVVAALVDRYIIIRRSNCSRSCSDIGLPVRWASCHVTWSRWRDWFIFTICSWSLHAHIMHAHRCGCKQNKTTRVNAGIWREQKLNTIQCTCPRYFFLVFLWKLCWCLKECTCGSRDAGWVVWGWGFQLGGCRTVQIPPAAVWALGSDRFPYQDLV